MIEAAFYGQEMVDDVLDLDAVDSEVEVRSVFGSHFTVTMTATQVIVEYIEWHEDLHQLHGLDDAV